MTMAQVARVVSAMVVERVAVLAIPTFHRDLVPGAVYAVVRFFAPGERPTVRSRVPSNQLLARSST